MEDVFNKLKEYNNWDKSQSDIQLNTGMERGFYLNKIEQYLGNKLIKVFIGQRRVGKSFLMMQVIKKLIKDGVTPQNIFYLNKELIDFDDVQNYKDLKNIIDIYKQNIKPKGKIYFFFDELQDIKEWERVINSLAQDPMHEAEVFISGSNSNMLSSELATHLTGRYITFEIFPFSYTEYITFFDLKNNKESFLNYVNDSGLPEFFNLQTDESKKNYLLTLKDSILLKDIVARYNVKDINLLSKILDYISDNLGNTFSVSRLVKYFKSRQSSKSFETISNYVLYLSQTFLIHEVSRYDIKGKKILDSGKKYFLNDLAFRNYIFTTFDAGLGGQLENLIFLHLRRLGYVVSIGKIAEYEIDFIAEKDGIKKYIQVAYSVAEHDVAKREFGNLKMIDDDFDKVVITLDDTTFGNVDGVKHAPIWEFLTTEA